MFSEELLELEAQKTELNEKKAEIEEITQQLEDQKTRWAEKEKGRKARCSDFGYGRNSFGFADSGIG